MTADEIRRISALVGGAMPEISSTHATLVEFNTTYIAGTPYRVLSQPDYTLRSSGLHVPTRLAETRPIDFVHVFITISDYLKATPAEIFQMVVQTHAPMDLLRELAYLAHVERDAELNTEFEQGWVDLLRPPHRAHVQSLLDNEHRRVLARQPILVSMLHILRWRALNSSSELAEGKLNPRLAALALTHAVAETLGAGRRDADPELQPQEFMLELAQNGQFNRSDHPWSLMLRYYALWTKYLPATRVDADPVADDLFFEATALTAQQHMACGFAAYAFGVGRKSDSPQLLSRSGIVDDIPFKEYLACSSLDLDELAAQALHVAGDWHFLPLMMHPILRTADDTLLILDEGLLLERSSTGLRHYVDTLIAGKQPASTHWAQHYSRAVEALAADALEALAPIDLDTGRRMLFRGDDIKVVTSGKDVDAAINFGADWCLFEVVSKRLTARAMLDGEIDAFKTDIQHLAIHKAEQLDAVSTSLLAGGAERLTSAMTAASRVFPVVVCPEGIPSNPLLGDYIRIELESKGLLTDTRIQPLVVLDLEDIELLETLIEHGITPVEVLSGWLASALHDVPLVSYVLDQYGARLDHWLPRRVKQGGDQMFADFLELLGLDERGEPQIHL